MLLDSYPRKGSPFICASIVPLRSRCASQKLELANSCLTDMINISIASFKLLLNEIKQIENKNSFIMIIIRKDLSKGASEKMASQDRHLQKYKLINNEK